MKKKEITGKNFRFKVIEYDKSIAGIRTFNIRLEESEIQTIYKRTIKEYADRVTRGDWKKSHNDNGEWQPSINQKVDVTARSRAFSINNNDEFFRTNNQGIVSVQLRLSDKLLDFSSDILNPTLMLLRDDGYILDEITADAFVIKKDNTEKTIKVKLSSGLSAIKQKAVDIYNRSITTVELNVLDKNSQVSIPNADIIIQGKNIEPENIISKYIEDTYLSEQVARFFPTFTQGTESFSSSQTALEIKLHPGTYKLKAKHPQYYYLEKNITVGKGTSQINLKLDELGTKTRVKMVQ